jgi:hypothetical protein
MKSRTFGIYPVTSVVQRRTGYIFVKIGRGEWISQARLNLEQRLGRKLSSNERVYHIDGNRENNDAENLVPITFNDRTYTLLSHSRALFIPDVTQEEVRNGELGRGKGRAARGAEASA